MNIGEIYYFVVLVPKEIILICFFFTLQSSENSYMNIKYPPTILHHTWSESWSRIFIKDRNRFGNLGNYFFTMLEFETRPLIIQSRKFKLLCEVSRYNIAVTVWFCGQFWASMVIWLQLAIIVIYGHPHFNSLLISQFLEDIIKIFATLQGDNVEM